MKRLLLVLALAISAHAQGGVSYPSTTTASPQFSIPYYSQAGNGTQLAGIAAPTSPAGVPQVPCQTPAGGVATTPISCLPGVNSRALTGTTNTDTILTTDCAPYVIEYLTSVAVAVTLPTATTLGVPKCRFQIINNTTGGSAVTVTPTTWTINGASALIVNPGQWATIGIDANNATNWVAVKGGGSTAIQGSLDQTGVSTANSGSAQNIVANTAVAGYYRVTYYVDQSAGCATLGSGALTVALGWTDATHARVTANQTLTVATVDTGTGDYLTQSAVIWAAAGTAITVTDTYVACNTGTWTYDQHVRAELVQ